MIHRLFQSLTEVRDGGTADMALELVLFEPSCVAARLLSARGKLRVQAFWQTGRVVAEVSEEVLSTCRRGDGWFSWRQELCYRIATEHARLLVACNPARDPFDVAEEAAKKASERVYGPGEPANLRRAMVCGAELAAVQALRAGGVAI